MCVIGREVRPRVSDDITSIFHRQYKLLILEGYNVLHEKADLRFRQRMKSRAHVLEHNVK